MPNDEQNEMTRDTRTDFDLLVDIFRKTSPHPTRRQLMRLSAMAAAAVATGRLGSVSAAPTRGTRIATRFQDDIVADAKLTIPFDPWGQSVTLDPHRTVNWGPFWVMFPNVWGGLLRYDQNGKTELDLAASMDISDDGLTYTFSLKPDLKFASGNPVTVDAFISSWQRALDPDNLSPMSDFMSLVQGYDAYISGDSTDIGFAAIDDATLSITLISPNNYFPSMLAAYVWSVVDPAVLADLGDDEFVLGGAGTGPWQFSDFDPSTQLVMTPNPNYWDGNSPSLSELTWVFLTGPDAANAAFEMYKDGSAISADVPLSLLDTVTKDEVLSSQLVRISPQGSVRAIGMDFSQPPFDDVRVRRAVALSIDRDNWANEIWQGTWAAGSSFSPPVLADIANYTIPQGIGFKPEGAKELLADAGFPDGEGLPTITYYEPAEDSDSDKARAAALLAMIKQNSGIDIVHDTSLTMQQIVDQTADNGGSQFDIVWWWNIYDTPHLMSVAGSPSSPSMVGVFNWNGDITPMGAYDPGADANEFEQLVNNADMQSDEESRNEVYRRAEKLLLKNAVYIPLGYWVQMYLQDPKLKGTRQGPWTGRLPVLFDKDVVLTSA